MAPPPLLPAPPLGPINDYPQQIKSLSKLADPMVYPLLFPKGDVGRSLDVKLVSGGNMSARQFYRYRLQIRNGFSNIHYGMKLFQEYVVDAWCKAESDTLWFIRKHQTKWRLAAEQRLRRYHRNRATYVAAIGVGVPAPPWRLTRAI